ncbi:hypothetical protein PCANC_19094 [Puccinia coronata f. sp. avenae]|uniref:Uncharacterized protein n=1 Tax=Puccinia coronata f. sp. avenae TaxID=200324 RepID=A0A2N5SSE8_9BASI|nr:hypothetical protein PCANC_19094 [Puccinia coronata f. sp. avenae]
MKRARSLGRVFEFPVPSSKTEWRNAGLDEMSSRIRSQGEPWNLPQAEPAVRIALRAIHKLLLLVPFQVVKNVMLASLRDYLPQIGQQPQATFQRFPWGRRPDDSAENRTLLLS